MSLEKPLLFRPNLPDCCPRVRLFRSMKVMLSRLLTGGVSKSLCTSCSFPRITFVVIETTRPFLRCFTTWAYLGSGGARRFDFRGRPLFRGPSGNSSKIPYTRSRAPVWWTSSALVKKRIAPPVTRDSFSTSLYALAFVLLPTTNAGKILDTGSNATQTRASP